MKYIYNGFNTSGLITEVQMFIENLRIGSLGNYLVFHIVNSRQEEKKKRNNAFLFLT